MKLHVESDQELRKRIAQKYGMWGAFLSVVLEAQGKALDECAESIGLKRIVVEIPDQTDHSDQGGS